KAGGQTAVDRSSETIDGVSELASPFGERAVKLGVIFRRVDQVVVFHGQLDQRYAELDGQLDPAVMLVHDAMGVATQVIPLVRSELRHCGRTTDLMKPP